MKTPILKLTAKILGSAIMISIVFTVVLLTFQDTSNQVPDIGNRMLAKKHEPSDAFFLQRMGPDGEFSLEAYTQALRQASQTAQYRTIDGFSEAWTTQGPGNIGARINTIAIHPGNKDIMFIGFSGGGVFKTSDGGSNWESIFNGQAFNAIGDIAIDPTNPDIIYVGTGDPNISGYPKIGDGLYRSTDAGATWTNIGLEKERIISEIIIDPTTPSTIFAACMGLPFERNADRGLYRSQDNGASWEKVLLINDETGIIDIAMHPSNPQIIYAAGWTRIRNNEESIIIGDNAQVYKSIDGGSTWAMVTNGLPSDVPHNRIGLAIAPSDPNTVYIEYVGANSQLESIYKSTDNGETWESIATGLDVNLDENALGGFGWYFGKIRVNPNNPDHLYLLGVDLWQTTNSGLSWELASPEWFNYEVHADKHDLAFTDNGNFVLATDGGLYRYSQNSGSWQDIENIPATQFYRVAYNPHQPDQYYGGAQDNGTSSGNADNINDWERIFGGDGFQAIFDPNDPNRFFVEIQRGEIYGTTNGSSFSSMTDGVNAADRRNWDMPYIMSPHNSEIMYLGTHRLYIGEGVTPIWSPISADLTDGDDGNSRNKNITAIDESILEEGLIYVGTGDGNIWRYNASNSQWDNHSNSVDQYVTDIVASPSNVEDVYVAYSGYRDNDFEPRIFRSTNQGYTWESIAGDLPNLSINALLILPETNDSIMFVATDGGVYGTTTAGESWERLGSNMPIVPVYDLVLNTAKNELVAGTFARSIMSYQLDSIRPLDDMSTPTIDEQVTINQLKVYPTLATQSVNLELENIEPHHDVEIAILNAQGQLVYSSSNTKGQHIVQSIDISDFAQGQYFVKCKVRHEVKTQTFIKQ